MSLQAPANTREGGDVDVVDGVVPVAGGLVRQGLRLHEGIVIGVPPLSRAAVGPSINTSCKQDMYFPFWMR